MPNMAAVAITVGGLIICAGCFLPWVTRYSWNNLPSWSSSTASGLDSLDGVAVLAWGVFLALLGASHLLAAGLPTHRLIMVLLALAPLGAALYEVARFSGGIDNGALGGMSYTIERGIYAIAAGATLVAGASLFGQGPATRIWTGLTHV